MSRLELCGDFRCPNCVKNIMCSRESQRVRRNCCCGTWYLALDLSMIRRNLVPGIYMIRLFGLLRLPGYDEPDTLCQVLLYGTLHTR